LLLKPEDALVYKIKKILLIDLEFGRNFGEIDLALQALDLNKILVIRFKGIAHFVLLCATILRQ